MTIRRTAPLALLVCGLVTACGRHASKSDTNQACTCAVYPFPRECMSVCKLTEYVVQSVNQKNVVVKQERSSSAQALEERTIPISSLPPKQIQDLKPGSHVQVLSKVENGQPVIRSLQINKLASK